MLHVDSGNGPRQRPPLCVLPENAATQGRAHVQPLLNSMLSCISTKLQTAVTNLVALRQPQDLSIGYPPSVPERLIGTVLKESQTVDIDGYLPEAASSGVDLGFAISLISSRLRSTDSCDGPLDTRAWAE